MEIKNFVLVILARLPAESLLDETRTQVKGGFLSRIPLFFYRLFLSIAIMSSSLLWFHRHLIPHIFLSLVYTFLFCINAFHANAIDPGCRYGNFPLLLQDIKAMLKKIYKKKVNEGNAFIFSSKNRSRRSDNFSSLISVEKKIAKISIFPLE